MRGRPKLEDSRSHQYRVRLNDEESRKLDYASSKTGKPKSDIFRLALISYYNQVLLNETNNRDNTDYWDLGGISLRRVVRCPCCSAQIKIDIEDECDSTTCERPMGTEILYEFDFEMACPFCGDLFRIRGHISEYPAGALGSEHINVSLP